MKALLALKESEWLLDMVSSRAPVYCAICSALQVVVLAFVALLWCILCVEDLLHTFIENDSKGKQKLFMTRVGNNCPFLPLWFFLLQQKSRGHTSLYFLRPF